MNFSLLAVLFYPSAECAKRLQRFTSAPQGPGFPPCFRLPTQSLLVSLSLQCRTQKVVFSLLRPSCVACTPADLPLLIALVKIYSRPSPQCCRSSSFYPFLFVSQSFAQLLRHQRSNTVSPISARRQRKTMPLFPPPCHFFPPRSSSITIAPVCSVLEISTLVLLTAIQRHPALPSLPHPPSSKSCPFPVSYSESDCVWQPLFTIKKYAMFFS